MRAHSLAENKRAGRRQEGYFRTSLFTIFTRFRTSFKNEHGNLVLRKWNDSLKDFFKFFQLAISRLVFINKHTPKKL